MKRKLKFKRRFWLLWTIGGKNLLIFFQFNFNSFLLSFSNGSIVNKLIKRGSVSEHAQRRNSEAREVKNEMSKLIETEESMTGTVTWALYGRYFQRMGILLSVVAIGSNLLYHTASVYSNGEQISFAL
jgi:hypothetical protein